MSTPFRFAIGIIFATATWLHAQTEPPHPILSIGGSGSSADSILSTWTETQYLDFVPRQSSRHNNFGFVPAVVQGDTGWSWSASSPNQITSTPSNTVFPNATYAIQYQSVGVLSGKTIQAPYYIRAGSSTGKSLVHALINMRKRDKLKGDLQSLAAKYMSSGTSHATRNQTYARRIAVALDDWAKYVPDYLMTEKNSPTYLSVNASYVLTGDKQRASDHNGLVSEWDSEELQAFDAIYDSPALAQLSTERGYDVRDHIKNNYFFNIGDFFKNRVPYSVATATNLSGPYVILPQVARVLNRPDYILWMDGYLNETVTKKIKRDGMLGEGLSYSLGYLNTNRSAADRTKDYFLSRPADTPQLVTAQANANAASSVLQYGQAQMNTIRLPDTRLPAFGDTSFDTSSSHSGYAASAILPAYGHVAMGSGTGSQATQVNQSFCAEGNHMRSDVTAFTLFAKNNELLGNIRYHHSPGRQYDEQILSHNAVTIDRTNMSRTGGSLYGNGNLTLYEPNNNGLAVTEIDGQRAYSNKASRYQRIMILNTKNPDRHYVLDIVRVTGGRTHDYVLHGAIRWDQTWECSFPLTANPATYPMLEGSETWNEPEDEGDSFPYYGFWREVSSGSASGDHQITYRDTNRTTARDLRLWMTDPGSATVYLGNTPVPERQDGDPPNFYKYWRPSLIERRRVSSGTLQTLFASVVEPLSAGASSIQSVTRVPIAGGGIEAVCIRVTFADGRVDTILVNLKNPKVAGATSGADTISTADGQYALTGRIGAYSTGPQGDRCWSVAASSFSFVGRQLTTPKQTYTGTITGETRKVVGGANDAFITSAALPVGTALRGKHLSLLFGSLSGSNTIGISEMFVIDEVKDIGGQRHVCFSRDHQLEISGTTTTEKMHPLRTFNGTNQFEIQLSASAAPGTFAPVTVDEDQSTIVPVGISDLADATAAELSVTAVSSNVTLVPNANLVITSATNPWTSADIGAVGVPGNSTAGSTFTIQASGADFWGNADEGHYIYQNASGDGQIIARVTSISNTNAWAKAGVMFRATTDAGSIHGHMLLSRSNGVAFQRRLATGGASTNTSVSGLTAPCWVRLVKSGTTLTGYYAPDNAGAPGAWVEVDSDTIPLGASFLAGLATTSHNDTTLCTATFDNVSSAAAASSGRQLTITPVPNGNGTANITLTASDGTNTLTQSFGVTVRAINDAPTITDIANQSIGANASTGALPFTIGDPDGASTTFNVTATSSNPTLIPNANLVLGIGSPSTSRTLTITPTANQIGSAVITVAVSDGTVTTSDTFTVNVTGTPSQAWRFQNFNTTANTGIAADLADPDKDGVVNLLEQALSSNPTTAGIASLPVAAIEGGMLTLSYTRNKAAMADLVFSAEWAASPGGAWSVSGVSESVVADNGTEQRVKASVAIADAVKFMRLRVTRP